MAIKARSAEHFGRHHASRRGGMFLLFFAIFTLHGQSMDFVRLVKALKHPKSIAVAQVQGILVFELFEAVA
jgi:predicted benzoate:H+ symporter BenE